MARVPSSAATPASGSMHLDPWIQDSALIWIHEPLESLRRKTAVARSQTPRTMGFLLHNTNKSQKSNSPLPPRWPTHHTHLLENALPVHNHPHMPIYHQYWRRYEHSPIALTGCYVGRSLEHPPWPPIMLVGSMQNEKCSYRR